MAMWALLRGKLPERGSCCRLLCLLACIAAVCAYPLEPAQALLDKTPRKIRVGIYPFSPFTFMDESGRACGLYPDLLDRIFENDPSVELMYVRISFSEGLKKLESQQLDLMVAVPYNPERIGQFDYNQSAVAEIWGEVYTRRDHILENIDNLSGKRVGISLDGFSGENFVHLAGSLSIECDIKRYPSQAAVFAAVAAEEVDAGVAANHYGIEHANQYNLSGSTIQFSPTSLYFAAKKGLQSHIMAHIDSQLIAWKNDPKSFYFDRREYWMRGRHEWAEDTPLWFWLCTGAIAVMAFLLFGINRFLNHRVLVQTRLTRDREEHLRTTLNSIGDAVIVTDADKRVTMINPVAEELTGWKLEESLGMPIGEIYPMIDEASRQQMDNPVDRVINDVAITGSANQALLIAKNGREIPIADSGAPILDKGGKTIGVVLVFRDQSEERAARHALEASEARYRLLFDNMSAGFALHEMIRNESGEPVDYRFLDTNPTFTALTGLPKSEVIGRTVSEVLPGTEQAWIEKYGFVESTGLPLIFEDYSAPLDKYFEVRVFRPAEGQFATIFQDVTERKKAEAALYETGAIQSLILDNSTLGIALIENREFQWVNPRLCQLFGMTEKELQDASTRILYTTENEYAEIGTRAYDVLGRGERFDHVIQFKRNDGTLFWCRLIGKALDPERPIEAGSLWMFEDISHRIESQMELTRLYTAIEQSPETIIITDANGCIEYVNPAFEHSSGYSREEAIGHNPRLLKSDTHTERHYRNLWKTIRDGHVWEGRFVNRRKDGLLFTEEGTVAPVKDSHGAIINYVAVKRDITEQLIREEELRQAQKMEAVGQLAGGIAHDFNNILQGIHGFSEILEATLEHGSLEHTNVLEIKKASKRASDLTRQLLMFSRKQASQITPIDLNNVVTDSEALLDMLLGSRHELVVELEPNMPTIMADHGQLTQVIMNLAVNSRDAMQENGRLTISTEYIDFSTEDAARIANANAGRYAMLAMTDTGCGMTEEVRQRLFEPFFTTKEVGSGTGLGLAVVYGIIKQHNGWINVYSEIGKGTSFKIYLPAKEQPAPKTTAPGKQQLPAKHILVVEDNPEVASMVEEILSECGHETITAGSAEEGMELFIHPEAQFDLLISDMELPGMRGDQLAERLRLIRPKLPVLLFSGYSDHKHRWLHIQQDGYIFMNKPFTGDTLLDSIKKLLSI